MIEGGGEVEPGPVGSFSQPQGIYVSSTARACS